jgi:hypothetical protein
MKPVQIVLGLILVVFTAACNNYEKNGDTVYYNAWNEGTGSSKHELDGVDADKFHVLKYDSYAKDDRLVFYKGKPIPGADAKTFEALGDYYAHDKFRGYYAGDSIKSSRGLTFRIINDYYTTDGNDIFFMTDPLKVKSAKNFRFVFDSGEDEWERWTTDGKYYFIKEFKVPSEDYTHMTLYKNSGGISKDSKWVYYFDRKINYDDSGKRVLDTLDLLSFKVTGYLKCGDKFGCINVYHGRSNCDPE